MATETNMDDLVFFVGDDWPTIPFVMDPVVDITSWDLEFSLYPDNNITSAAILTRTTGSSQITITSGILGTFEVGSIPAALTVALSPKAYVWRVHRTTSGVRRELAFGTIPVRA